MMELMTDSGTFRFDDSGTTKISGKIRDDIVKVNGRLPDGISVEDENDEDKNNHGA